MKKTENINLLKPDQTDFYNVDDFNANADIIDEELMRARTHSNDAGAHGNLNHYTDLDAHENLFKDYDVVVVNDQSIQTAIDEIPITAGKVTISIASGTYNEDIVVSHKQWRELVIDSTDKSSQVTINSLKINRLALANINHLTLNGNVSGTRSAMYLIYTNFGVGNCKFVGSNEPNSIGFNAYGSNGAITYCDFNNYPTALNFAYGTYRTEALTGQNISSSGVFARAAYVAVYNNTLDAPDNSDKGGSVVTDATGKDLTKGGFVKSVNGTTVDSKGNVDVKSVTFEQGGQLVSTDVDGDKQVVLHSDTSGYYGPYLQLYRTNSTVNPGSFVLSSRFSNGLNAPILFGRNDGLLQWNTKNIVRSVNGTNADINGNVTINAGGSAYITETWASADKSSWYRVWSDGFIEQGYANGGYGDCTITFVKPFKTNRYISNAGMWIENHVSLATSPSTTSFRMWSLSTRVNVTYLYFAGY